MTASAAAALSSQGDDLQRPERTAVPDTPTPAPTPTKSKGQVFDAFVETIKTGEEGRIVGLYAEKKIALQVVYQPEDDSAFVSTQDGTTTYFMVVHDLTGNYGFLAHNYLAGRFFFELAVGDIVEVIYGDGDYEDFEVLDIREYQALSPGSPYSDFIDTITGEQIDVSTMFGTVYQGPFHITLQTCIARGDEDSWGRIFLLAPPMQ